MALVAYGHPEKIGACGEAELLTVTDAELRRVVPVGTAESEAAIKEVEQKSVSRKAVFDEEDEDEEDF